MYLCLFEDDRTDHLLPLVYTRAVYDLRLGRRTLLATTRDAFGRPPTLLHARPLVAQLTAAENDLLTGRIPKGLDVLFVNGRYVAEPGSVLDRLRAAARPGEPARVFLQDDQLLAAWVPGDASDRIDDQTLTPNHFDDLPHETVSGARLIGRLWHLLDGLDAALRRDYEAAVEGNVYERPGTTLHDGVVLLAAEQVYVAPGATIYPGAVLNAESGPIYIDVDATVEEHTVLRGPLYVGSKAVIKAGAKVEGSAIGYWSKVAGEVHGSIVHSLSNKAHAGYLGDSYLGRWCNLGADTNTSNLRNDYGEVSLFNTGTEQFEGTGRQFLGLVLADHAKSSINSMFNTGTVVGVASNVFGSGFPPRHIPSFSWGGPDGFTTYRLDKALEVAAAVMARRDRVLTDAHRENLKAVFEATARQREST